MEITSVGNFYTAQKNKPTTRPMAQTLRLKETPSCDYVSFGTFKAQYRKHRPDTCFFRDMPTLEAATEYLQKTFPKGAVILDYACSNGEEAISLDLMLNCGSSKYPVRAFDVSQENLDETKKGYHYISCAPDVDDLFLLNNYTVLNENGELKKRFHAAFTEIEPPWPYDTGFESNFFEPEPKKYWFVQNEPSKNIEYALGDINEIDELNTRGQKVGAVFFRNAFYQLLQDDVEKGTHSQKLDELAEKIYDKLEPGGIFVMGNHAREADIFDNEDDKKKTFKLPYRSKYKNEPSEYCNLRMTSVHKAFAKKFEPEALSAIQPTQFGFDYFVTVWKKPEPADK